MSGQYQERKEYFKQYREKNKERLQQKRHDYYEENKDRIKEYAKQWKQDNPSLVWLQKQEYFEKYYCCMHRRAPARGRCRAGDESGVTEMDSSNSSG